MQVASNILYLVCFTRNTITGKLFMSYCNIYIEQLKMFKKEI